MPITSLTSSSITAVAPEPTSSVSVNTAWQSIGTEAPLSRTAFSAASTAATPALLSRCRETT